MTIDLGQARAIDFQTFGEPGQRTFRLRAVGAAGQTASLWLEKQQLQAFDMAFSQVLAQLNYTEELAPADLSAFPEKPEHDFRVGRIGLGFDPSDRGIVVHAFEMAVEDEQNPTLSVRLTAEQCAGLVPQIRAIVEAGRPTCPLCGAGIDPTGHTCIRSNGHSRQAIPDPGQPDES